MILDDSYLLTSVKSGFDGNASSKQTYSTR
jgi:hypothetical protein